MANSKKLKIPYGERENELIHISQVEKGLACNCLCPGCKTPLVARKGNRTTHHFAHHKNSACSVESVLHKIGKYLFYRKIRNSIVTGTDFPIIWQCSICPDSHRGNLTKNANKVRMEMAFGACRPDLALLRSDDSPFAFIEVVVSHKPEDNVLLYAKLHKIHILQYVIKDEADLQRIEYDEPLIFDSVDLCKRIRCPKCKKPMSRLKIGIANIPCSYCGLKMPIAIMNAGGHVFGVEHFTQEEIAKAEDFKCCIMRINDMRTGVRGLVHTCPNCGRGNRQHAISYYWPQVVKIIHEGFLCVECKLRVRI